MKRYLSRFVLVGALALASTACSHRMTEFTALSTKNLNIKGDRGSKRVTGTSCGHTYFGLGSSPNMKDAIDRAIESAGPGYDALEDGVVSGYVVPVIVYWVTCVEVTGTPVNTKAVPNASNLMLHSEPVASR